MPVIRPIRAGNLPLISPGSSTLQAAIASPISAVPVKKVTTPAAERSRIPIDSASIASSRIFPSPYLRASCGAKGDNSAKASSGKVVMNPASVLVKPRSSRISPSSGPTEVNGARSAAATNSMPSTSRKRPDPASGRDMPGFCKVRSCGFAVMMFLPVAAQNPDKPGLVRVYCPYVNAHCFIITLHDCNCIKFQLLLRHPYVKKLPAHKDRQLRDKML